MGIAGSLLGTLVAIASVAAGPPRNLDAGAFTPTVQSMWRHSPTFRRQCFRVASQPRLRVTITANITRPPSDARAITTLVRKRGAIVVADIVLLSPTDIVELIAHEMEHVIEQIEGVNLRINSCDGSRNPQDRYESCRAIEAGLQVAREVRQARRRSS